MFQDYLDIDFEKKKFYIKKYEQLKEYYNRPNRLCGHLGKVYVTDNDELYDIKCRKFHCKKCINFLKYVLYLEIIKNVYCFELDRHFVITFDRNNKNYENVKWYESYYIMNKEWNKLRLALARKYGKIIYILLPRSQKSGFCHYHILLNKYVSWKWLNIIRKKYNFGYMSIQRNKSVAEYLANDYYKNNEWIIPFGIRHYRSSREIELMRFNKNNGNIFFNGILKIDEIKNLLKHEYNILYDENNYYVNKIIDRVNNGF